MNTCEIRLMKREVRFSITWIKIFIPPLPCGNLFSKRSHPILVHVELIHYLELATISFCIFWATEADAVLDTPTSGPVQKNKTLLDRKSVV